MEKLSIEYILCTIWTTLVALSRFLHHKVVGDRCYRHHTAPQNRIHFHFDWCYFSYDHTLPFTLFNCFSYANKEDNHWAWAPATIQLIGSIEQGICDRDAAHWKKIIQDEKKWAGQQWQTYVFLFVLMWKNSCCQAGGIADTRRMYQSKGCKAMWCDAMEVKNSPGDSSKLQMNIH